MLAAFRDFLPPAPLATATFPAKIFTRWEWLVRRENSGVSGEGMGVCFFCSRVLFVCKMLDTCTGPLKSLSVLNTVLLSFLRFVFQD